MATIYLIIGESGEYSSYTSSVVEAWSDKTKALARYKQLSEQIAAAVAAYHDQHNRFQAHRHSYQMLPEYRNAEDIWRALPDSDRPRWEAFFIPIQVAEAEHGRQWLRSFWQNEAPLPEPAYDRFCLFDIELDQEAPTEVLYHPPE